MSLAAVYSVYAAILLGISWWIDRLPGLLHLMTPAGAPFLTLLQQNHFDGSGVFLFRQPADGISQVERRVAGRIAFLR